MKRITIFFALVGGLVADFLIAMIKAIKKPLKLFSAMTMLLGVLFIAASLFLMYICCATAERKDEINGPHVSATGELMGIDYDVIEEVA